MQPSYRGFCLNPQFQSKTRTFALRAAFLKLVCGTACPCIFYADAEFPELFL